MFAPEDGLEAIPATHVGYDTMLGQLPSDTYTLSVNTVLRVFVFIHCTLAWTVNGRILILPMCTILERMYRRCCTEYPL